MSTPKSSSGSQPPADAPVAAPASWPLRAALILLMVIGSITMWIVVPLALVYGVSQTQTSTQPSLGPYLLILVGVPLGMTVIGKLLGSLDRLYGRRTGTVDERRRAAWLQSMRGERREGGEHRWKVLDVVMLWSVGIAGTAMAVWFFFFAGSPR